MQLTEEISVEDMPSIEQIRDFLRYRRLKLSKNYSIQGVEDFISSHTLRPDYDPDALFFFGAEIFFRKYSIY